MLSTLVRCSALVTYTSVTCPRVALLPSLIFGVFRLQRSVLWEGFRGCYTLTVDTTCFKREQARNLISSIFLYFHVNRSLVIHVKLDRTAPKMNVARSLKRKVSKSVRRCVYLERYAMLMKL